MECKSKVVWIGSIIIVHPSKLWKDKLLLLCDAIFLVRLQRKFDIDHSWERKGFNPDPPTGLANRISKSGSRSWAQNLSLVNEMPPLAAALVCTCSSLSRYTDYVILALVLRLCGKRSPRYEPCQLWRQKAGTHLHLALLAPLAGLGNVAVSSFDRRRRTVQQRFDHVQHFS